MKSRLITIFAALAAIATLSAARLDVGSERATRLPPGAPVQIWRDSLAVPHLWAENESDLAYALGYVHAQDRLSQMEISRRVADGRLAEILGRSALDSDRFLRTLSIGRAAATEEATLDPDTRAILTAYAAGVNRWIATHRDSLPTDYRALGVAPEPWSIRNSLAIAKLMSWDLADWQIGLDLQRAMDEVGRDRARDLFPAYPSWGPRIIPGGAPTAASSHTPPAGRGAVPIPRIPGLAASLLGAASATSASNAWVIDGSRTTSGKPILANDPHLDLRSPSIWYLAALHGGATNVAGATIPGLPVVVLGHTATVAWGFTNGMVDDVDLFIERLDPADSARYLAPSGSEPFVTRQETIAVRGAPSVTLQVRETRHGPIISDLQPSGDRLLALQWTALSPSTSVRAMRAMNRARTAADLVEALRDFNEPHQNVVFADAAGTIGYWLAGRVPVRRSGDGLLPVPGWTGEADWIGFLDFDRHPHIVRPAEGFIVTANNPPGGGGSLLGSTYAPPFRAMRIREMLATGTFSANDVARQQMDVRDLAARRYLPLAIAAAAAAGQADAADSLAAWDGEARVDSRAAAIFYLWYEELRGRVGNDEWRGRPVYFPRESLDRILDAGGGGWVDDVRTAGIEDLATLSAAAMRAAAARAGSRTWGEIHATHIRPMTAPGILPAADARALGPFPSPGSSHTVNVAGYGRTPPFVSTYGASTRHVVDLADPDRVGGFVIPAGQSADPSSPHYLDQTSRWRENRLWTIPLDREQASRKWVTRSTLTPE